MSYDLNFWKQDPRQELDPKVVYERLSDGERVEGLEEIPIDRILARVAEKFVDGWQRLGEHTWESAQGGFQIYTTAQLFRVDCYGLSGEIMNLFIDIAHEFGCNLYDPQTCIRYEE